MSSYRLQGLNLNTPNELDLLAEKVVPANADRLILEDSEDNFLKKYLQVANLPTAASGSDPAGILTVAPSGAEYTSIQAAMNDASSGQTVLVYPGTYAEDLDFTNVASAVRVTGYPNAQNCIITGSSPTSTRVIMTKTATLREMTVVSPDAGSNNAISCSLPAGQLGVIFNVVVVGGNGTNTSNGVYMTGSGILVGLGGLYHNGGTLGGSFIRVDEGSVVMQQLIGNIGSASAFFSQYGGTVEARDWLTQNSVLYKSRYGIEHVGGKLNINGFQNSRTLPSAQTCIYVPSGSITQEFQTVQIFGSEYDFQVPAGVDGTDSVLIWSACNFRIENATAPAVWANNLTTGLFNYTDAGINNDPTTRMGGTFSVGAFSRTADAYFGRGGDFSQFMHVFSDDGTSGSFVDNTTAAKSSNGSTFSLFQNTGSGHTAYFGNSIVQFPAIRVNITASGSLNTGSNDVIWEYLGTGSWTSFNVLATPSTADDQYASNVFTRTGEEYIRFDSETISENWITGSVNGQNGYWVRMRLQNEISGSPTLERVLLTPDRSSFAGNGFLVSYGTAQHTEKMNVHQRLFDDAVGASPANKTINLSSNINLSPADNQFNNNADDGLALISSVETGYDTSRQFKFKVGWFPTSNGSGTVSFRLNVVDSIFVGNNIDAGNLDETEYSVCDTLRPSGTHQTNAVATVEANTADQLYVSTFNFRLSNLEPNLFFALSFFRRSSSIPDTYSGNIAIAFIELEGTRWRI